MRLNLSFNIGGKPNSSSKTSYEELVAYIKNNVASTRIKEKLLKEINSCPESGLDAFKKNLNKKIKNLSKDIENK